MSAKQYVTIVHDNGLQNTSFVELVKRYQNVRQVDIQALCAENLKRSLLIIVQVDLARMAAIADVFSGLTDKRSYKPSIPAERAIAIMLNMEGHLDLPLVKSFRAVALPELATTVAVISA